jgi:hypothetical protein
MKVIKCVWMGIKSDTPNPLLLLLSFLWFQSSLRRRHRVYYMHGRH